MRNDSKEKIAAAFSDLLAEKPFGKITVNNIVDVCGVHRNTFYYYFSDIPDLLDYVTEQHLDIILLRNGKVGFLNGCMVDLIEYMEKNDKAMSGIFNSMTKDELLTFVDHATTYLVERYLEMNYGMLSLDEDDRDMLVRIFASGVAGIFLKWFHNHKDFDISADIDKVSKLFSDNILRILRSFSEKDYVNRKDS